MTDNRKINLCITTYNRVDMTLRSFAQVANDPRISEIVIVDDGSPIEVQMELAEKLTPFEKVQLFKSFKNKGVYENKMEAIGLGFKDWCILLDSDNIIGIDYLDTLYAIPEWDQYTSYLPSFARPTFDYRHFAGETLTKINVGSYMGYKMFDCLINTMNGFYHKWEYYRVWDTHTEPLTADSMYMNYLFLQKGNKLKIVPGLEYEHTIHDGSHFKIHSHENIAFRDKLLNDYKLLH